MPSSNGIFAYCRQMHENGAISFNNVYVKVTIIAIILSDIFYFYDTIFFNF